MNSRERILLAINHIEPDRIPYDLAGTTWTGITEGAYNKLDRYLGFEKTETVWADVIQQIVVPSEEVLQRLKVDTRGLLPLTSHNWDVYEKLTDRGNVMEYIDEWGFTHHFPKIGGHWFSLVKSPLENSEPDAEVIDRYQWPDAVNRIRIKGLKEKALKYREEGKIVILKGLCAGVFEMQQRLRGMSNALIDPLIYPDFSDLTIGKLAELKIEFWKMALQELGGLADIIAEGDDYGTQESQLIDPEHFRNYYKRHVAGIIKTIREIVPYAKVMFHSCGNVRPLIPDFIEMGIDILNPVHISAAGMEPESLKSDFGNDIVFWGGGVETQHILPNGKVNEVADNVKRNIDALAPGGGFVFTTVHNIQSEVPPQNIMAMWETLQKHGKY